MRTSQSLLLAFLCVGLISTPSVQAEELRKIYHSFCGKGWFGIFDESGKVLIAPQYERADILHEYGVIGVGNKGKEGLVDLSGKTLLPIMYDDIGRSTDGLRPVRIGKDHFYLNEKGQPAFDFKAFYISDFRFGYSVATLADKRQILIDRNGKIIFEADIEDDLYIASSKIAFYKTDNSRGWIDLVSGKVHPSNASVMMVNGVLMEDASRIPILGRPVYLLTRQNQKTRKIDGYKVITKDRKILVQNGKTFNLLDVTPDEIADPNHTSPVEGQKNPAYSFWHEGKFGLVNGKGVVILPPLYEDIGTWSEGKATIQKNGLYGLVNDLGKVILPPVHDRIELMRDGMSAARSAASRWGFIDENGKTAVPFEYDEVIEFSHGLGRVKKNGRWLQINKKGEIFLPMEYEQEVASVEGDLIALSKITRGCPDYFDLDGKAVFKTVVDQDGTERFVDIRRDKTIWTSKGTPSLAARESTTGLTGYLKGEFTSRGNRYCRYDNGTVLTLPAAQLCPPSHDSERKQPQQQ